MEIEIVQKTQLHRYIETDFLFLTYGLRQLVWGKNADRCLLTGSYATLLLFQSCQMRLVPVENAAMVCLGRYAIKTLYCIFIIHDFVHETLNSFYVSIARVTCAVRLQASCSWCWLLGGWPAVKDSIAGVSHDLSCNNSNDLNDDWTL